MRIRRNLRLSVRALVAHRARTALATAGTAAGVAAVLVLTAVGQGARRDVIERMDALGASTLLVSASTIDPRAGRPRQGDGNSRDMRASDALAIVSGTRRIVRAAAAQDGGRVAKRGRFQAPVTVVGTTADWLAIRGFHLFEGRFIDAADDAMLARVAVIGATVRAALFSDSSAIGATVRIGRVPFTIVGVLDGTGISVDGSGTEDDRIVVPLATAQRRLFNVTHVKMIYLEAADARATSLALEDANAILRARRDPLPDGGEAFVIRDRIQLIAAQVEAQASFQRLIGALGLLSLLVGAAGILSIMLLSVRERRPEIGLRMAAGARRSDIALQFMTESMMLAAAGGTSGITVGFAAAAVVSSTTRWDAAITPAAFTVALGAATAVGVLCGLLPAWRASGLDPVEALRAE
jgi:putative ABC transport system permease protein